MAAYLDVIAGNVRGSRSPLIAEPGDQKDTFNRRRQVSNNGMGRDLGRFDKKVFVSEIEGLFDG